MRKSIALVATVALFAALAATALAATKRVNVGDNYFVRSSGTPTVTVRKGDTVRWVWVGRKAHNVRVTKGPVKFSSRIQSSGRYAKRMTRRGTYTLICDVHGAADQRMKLVVR